jgi:DNA helicase-2/ATP-dependent DNA helicase PcrA
MTAVEREVKSIRAGLDRGQVPRVRKHINVLQVLLEVVHADSVAAVEPALQALAEVGGAAVYRRELLREAKRAVRAVVAGDAASMTDAAWLVRNRARQQGRLLSRCAVGTTLLVKGLEFDHAVLLDADTHDARNLYVALTRGARTLTIVSGSSFIRPTNGRSRTAGAAP